MRDRTDLAEKDQQLQALLHRFELPLLQYATRIMGDRDRARDVVQETFVQLQRDGSELHDDAPAKWLLTVCRKEKRMTYLDHELLEAREGDSPLPFDRMEKEEASGFLLRIIATLPPRQQEVLQLKFQNAGTFCTPEIAIRGGARRTQSA